MLTSNSEVSPIHHAFDAADFKPGCEFRLGRDYDMDEAEVLMRKIGVGFNPGVVESMMASVGMDSIQQPMTTQSIPVALQFLQEFLPGFVQMITAARKIDELTGIQTAAEWSDEQVIQQVLEVTGSPTPYNDLNNVPLANWNTNYVTRTIVRHEMGMKVGLLEQARAAKIRIASDAVKRQSAALQLEITRNAIGFYGYNNGLNLTYGFLNDPNLPAYVTVATFGGNVTWATKSFLGIQADLLSAFQTLRTQSQDTIEPDKTPITLAVATSCVDYLAKTSDFGISVWGWLKQFYPNVRVVSAPQLNGANGGANVFYAYADVVNDGASTDDQRTFTQVVPSKFQLLGVQQMTKGYEEDYLNATAGVINKRPYAVVRRSGI